MQTFNRYEIRAMSLKDKNMGSLLKHTTKNQDKYSLKQPSSSHLFKCQNQNTNILKYQVNQLQNSIKTVKLNIIKNSTKCQFKQMINRNQERLIFKQEEHQTLGLNELIQAMSHLWQRRHKCCLTKFNPGSLTQETLETLCLTNNQGLDQKISQMGWQHKVALPQ